MIIGWDSKTDTFFVSGLNEQEAEALQGTIGSVFEHLRANSISVGICRLTDEQYMTLLFDLQKGLYDSHKLRQKLRGT